MSRLLKGVGVLTIEVAVINAENPDCNTSVSVAWTDLGEMYQVERKLNAGGAWGVIYTGSAFVFNDTVANSDGVYFYRVRVITDDTWSNVDSVQVYEQDKFLHEECAEVVAPNRWRTAYRFECGERYEYIPDDDRCKPPCTNASATVNWSYTLDDGSTPQISCYVSGVYFEPGQTVTGQVGDTIADNLSIRTGKDQSMPTNGTYYRSGAYNYSITVYACRCGFENAFGNGTCRGTLTITGFTLTGCD